MAELGGDFYDVLKGSSSGYASFDYERGELRKADLLRLDIMLNGEMVDALARVVHRWAYGFQTPSQTPTEALAEILGIPN